jgi:hypothetical protein
MTGLQGADWGKKIEAILDRFDFGRCVIYLRATGGQPARWPGGAAGLLSPGEGELRRLAGKLLHLVTADPEPVSHACAAGMVALKSDDELHLYFSIESRAA